MGRRGSLWNRWQDSLNGGQRSNSRYGVAEGNKAKGTIGGFPPCPPLDDGGAEVFVETGGTGVTVGTGVLEGVTPGGRVSLGVLVKVGGGVSDGVTPGTSVIVPIGDSVAVGVAVSVGAGVNVFVETGGGGET